MFPAIPGGEPTPCRADSGCCAAGAADHGGAGGRCRGCSSDAQATALPAAGVPCQGRAAGDQPPRSITSPPQSAGSADAVLQAPATAASAAPRRCRCSGTGAYGLGGEDRRQLRSAHCSPEGGLAAAGDDRIDQSSSALQPVTGPFSALWTHVCEWRDHPLSAGQRISAHAPANVAGASCSRAAVADVGGMRDGDAGATGY